MRCVNAKQLNSNQLFNYIKGSNVGILHLCDKKVVVLF